MDTPTERPSGNRCETGIAGLNDILGGGLSRNRLYLLQGDPGVGKTTLAMQYLLQGAAQGEPGLYITLSETKNELLEVSQSHGWAIDKIALLELSAIEKVLAEQAQNTLFHPSELELSQTTKILMDEIDRVKPTRVVFDSLSEMRLLAETALRYRRQMLSLKQFFSGRQITVLFLDDRTSGEGDLQIQSIAHGVLALEKSTPQYGIERRRLKVVKMRGQKFRSGFHDFIIDRGGLQVFPRLIAAEHHKAFKRESVSSGIPQLDAVLGGGLDRGTSNLFIGPAGTGKSTMASLYAATRAAAGEKVIYFTFDENTGTLIARAQEIGLDLQNHLQTGNFSIQQIDPAELSPGQLVQRIRDAVEKNGARVVVIDSLNGYLNAMPDENFLSVQMHELLTFLAQQGILTIMTMAQHSFMGPAMNSPVDLSYLADTVVMLRYFEAMGSVRKAISVVKKRSGYHEPTIREFKITSDGIFVGEALREFQGVLTGVPTFFGKNEQIISPNPNAGLKTKSL